MCRVSISEIVSRLIVVVLMILLLNIYKFKLSNIRLISVYFLCVSVLMVFSLLFV